MHKTKEHIFKTKKKQKRKESNKDQSQWRGSMGLGLKNSGNSLTDK